MCYILMGLGTIAEWGSLVHCTVGIWLSWSWTLWKCVVMVWICTVALFVIVFKISLCFYACRQVVQRLCYQIGFFFCHRHISVMELDHLLNYSGLTYPEVSSKVCHDSFYQLENSVSLPWVICYEAFYLHVVSSFSCIPVICPKLVLFLIPL